MHFVKLVWNGLIAAIKPERQRFVKFLILISYLIFICRVRNVYEWKFQKLAGRHACEEGRDWARGRDTAHMVYLHPRASQIQWTVVCRARLKPCYVSLHILSIFDRSLMLRLFYGFFNWCSLCVKIKVLYVTAKLMECVELDKFVSWSTLIT